MRVDTSLLQGIAAANQAAQAKSSSSKKTSEATASFSSALKSATASSAKETTKPVEGQNYSEITSGPRAGMYLNTGGGARDGQAFVLVKHDGQEDHIYGTGKDRKVVTIGGDKSDSASSSDKPSSSDKASTTDKSSSTSKAPANETTKPVEGRGYADILTGKRSGLYLNTSGNVRDGQTFALVKRDGREFHIYGTGKDREIIGLKKPDDAAKTGSTTNTDTTKTPTTTDTSNTAGTNDKITTDASTSG